MKKLIGYSETSGRPVFRCKNEIETGCFIGSVEDFIKRAAIQKKSWVLELEGMGGYRGYFNEVQHISWQKSYFAVKDFVEKFGATVSIIYEGEFVLVIEGHELLPFNAFWRYFKEKFTYARCISVEGFLTVFKAEIQVC